MVILEFLLSVICYFNTDVSVKEESVEIFLCLYHSVIACGIVFEIPFYCFLEIMFDVLNHSNNF